MPGVYKHVGKEAFDKEIENENFVGSPAIQITRLVEEDDVVIAEGSVQGNMKNGGRLDAVFCDVFLMQEGKIKQLTSYLMSKNASLKFE
jgi:ketosteroid isomerase-like protein